MLNERHQIEEAFVHNDVQKVRLSMKRLHEIALNPDLHSILEYIDVLIESERAEASPGWKERVEQLREARKQSQYIKKIADQGFD